MVPPAFASLQPGYNDRMPLSSLDDALASITDGCSLIVPRDEEPRMTLRVDRFHNLIVEPA